MDKICIIEDDLKLSELVKEYLEANGYSVYIVENFIDVEAEITREKPELLLLSLGSLGIFFFIATAIVLFLKLLSDIDGDKKRFNSMFKIGITDNESLNVYLKFMFKPKGRFVWYVSQIKRPFVMLEGITLGIIYLYMDNLIIELRSVEKERSC